MKVIITGGAGFIGINVALRHLNFGDEIVLIDNLSRKGTRINLKLVEKNSKVKFYKTDIRNFSDINKIFKLHKDASIIYHLAAQVAVTTSVFYPRQDFEINVLGTLNILESMRINKCKGLLIYASTNKVYGGMENAVVKLKKNRYQYIDYTKGIDENFNLDFHSPYGCSKGAADQYVRDYHRIYGLNTTVFRQSCIYGQNQFGVEDQGWVAYFIIAAVLDLPITIYGDGKQVRDILWVEDLIDAYLLAYKNIKVINGQIFNIGGGPKNQMSLLELISILEKKINKKIKLKFSTWRPGDQKIFVSNNNKLEEKLTWRPKVCANYGIDLLISWVKKNSSVIKKILTS